MIFVIKTHKNSDSKLHITWFWTHIIVKMKHWICFNKIYHQSSKKYAITPFQKQTHPEKEVRVVVRVELD